MSDEMIFIILAVALVGLTIAARLLVAGRQQMKHERHTSNRPKLREQVEQELEMSLAQAQANSPINQNSVRQIVERDFANEEPAEIMAILNGYGQDSTEFGRARVHLAFLSLSKGDVAKLRSYVNAANIDYRDVLMMAEAPASDRRSPAQLRSPWAVEAWWEKRSNQRLLAFFIVLMIILVWVLYNS